MITAPAMTVKSTRTLLSTILLMFIIFIFCAGCKKETSASHTPTEKNLAELLSTSNLEFIQAFDDVYNNVMGVNSEVAYGETGVFGRIITIDSSLNPCFVVKITRLNAPAAFPAEVEIDFGTGCIGRDSIIRKGKISTIYTGPLTQAGKVAETSFENFYIDGVKIEGQQRIENKSTALQCIFNITVKDGKLTKPNSSYCIFNSNYTIKQIEGNVTPNYAKDDVLNVSMESNASLKNDSVFLSWNSKTIEPLIKTFTCRWYAKGKLETLQSNADAGIIDFGNGGCDNKANLTINNSTIEISLH